MTTPTKDSSLGRWARRGFGVLRNALAAFGLTCLVYLVGFNLSQVSSDSMQPTLRGSGQPGSDWILTEKVSYWFRSPRRWEVAQFLTSDSLLVAKRVIGLPGETVALRDKHIFINEQGVTLPASLSYLHYYAVGNLRNGKPVASGTGYYVLGDDSRDSMDSRWDGPVQPAQIRARAWLRVWPPSRIGFINP
jgi:signal peptidase I